jgi:hypothetical protein
VFKGLHRDIRKSDTKQQMAATMYGKQFEMLMAEVCREFGAKLIKSWEAESDLPLDKSEIRDFVEEAVATFFKVAEVESEVKVVSPKKKRGGKVAKEPEPDSPVGLDDDIYKPKFVAKAKAKRVVAKAKKAESPKPVAKGKGKAKVEEEEEKEKEKEERATEVKAKGKAAKGKGKPKCEAMTAKGTRCSKCAVEGGVFCAVHVKSKEDKPKKEAKKKEEKKEVKHTHGLTSPAGDCELCEMHGEAFEMPEYEVMGSEEGSEAGDPTYELEEEDFDDLD